MKVAVIRYNAGNIHSVTCALTRLGADWVVTDDRKTIMEADRVIFPGVGEASSAMSYIRANGLDGIIASLRAPFLGICLGMQLMCASSEEGNTECLSVFDGRTVLFPKDRGYKIPHMGWNSISSLSSPLFRGIEEDSYVYFVHSFYVPSSPCTIAKCSYDGIDFSAALSKDNYFGVQFHPEKSGRVGERILSNFLGDGIC
ncbi:MAG: imidazole glycerol phosphate synthase subunit HisH [Candidatus Ornithospirochaeta sp.]|nr:imidazole glycerol phosphate synthase subunit HisH [Candidatus Ornithospirochaeta sp.]